MAKPGDFFIGAVQFFSLLLPGAILAFLVDGLLQPSLAPLPRPTGAAGWIAFLVVAYVLGHLLDLVRSFALDGVLFDRGYVRFRRRHGDPVLARVQGALERKFGGDVAALGLLQATTLYLRGSHPAIAEEVDRVEAESKFLGALAVMLAAAGAVLLAAAHDLPLAPRARLAGVACLALSALMAWRYARLRWKAMQAAYVYLLLVAPWEGVSVVHFQALGNLRRWIFSGEPKRWVEAHLAGWSHDDWLKLVRDLERGPYWPMPLDAVGLTLEATHRAYRAARDAAATYLPASR